MSTTNDEFLAYWTSIETDTRKALILGARTDTEKLHDLLRTVYEAGAKREASPLPAAQGEPTMPRPAKHGDIPKPWAYFTADQMHEWGAIQRQKCHREELALHRQLAAETLRADQGWSRYEEANADRNALRERLATSAPTAGEPSARPDAACLPPFAEPASQHEASSAAYGPVHVVRDLVRNLMTLDQSAPIYSAFHVDYQGERRCRTRPASTSWERVIDGKWVDPARKDVPYAVIVWAKPEADEQSNTAGSAKGGMQDDPVPLKLHPSSEYHEDYSDVLWFAFPSFNEAPQVYCGSPLEVSPEFDDEHWTHFARVDWSDAIGQAEAFSKHIKATQGGKEPK